MCFYCKLNSLFVLASTIPPIPAKIVQKIQSNQFVDMKDLLPDNVALLDKLDGLGQALLHHQALVRACGKSLASCLGQAACLKRLLVISRQPTQI